MALYNLYAGNFRQIGAAAAQSTDHHTSESRTGGRLFAFVAGARHDFHISNLILGSVFDKTSISMVLTGEQMNFNYLTELHRRSSPTS